MADLVFTQEQLDTLIADKTTEAKKGLYTEEELTRKVTAEVDRRVESGIQKGLDTHKTKWEHDYSEKAKLSAGEIAKRELDGQMKAVTAKEQEIKRKANLLDAKELLSDAQIPKTNYEKLLVVLVSEDEMITKANVQNFIDMFNTTKTEIETRVKTELSGIPKPNTGASKSVTSDDFKKMSYGEMMKFKQSNPELYKEYMK